MKKIITRFPPSPTGYLHIGGARTALFNWLYARHMKGKFILRIEDTDTARSTQESVDAIFESLEWLGIDWDEGPFFQSQRFGIYTEYIQKLLDSGFAYYCTCSPEKLEEMRKKAMEVGGKPKYDGTCREKGLGRTDNAVIRFKAPISGTTVLEDVIKGNIVFQNEELDDFIIARSDGSPTYNFVVVVDDITMGINTVLRGDDHVMNTPRQILLYKALNSPLPTFGHVPMVLGSDRTRLSKRHGAMSVTAYRDMGYLPDAFINYLVRLGWSYGDQEFFSRDELVEKFSLENIGRSAGIFNPEKLLALNADHIKATPPDELIKYLSPFLKEKGYSFQEGPFIESVIRTLNARSKTLKDMADDAGFYFTDTVSYDEKAAKKNLKAGALEPLQKMLERFSAVSDWKGEALHQIVLDVAEELDLKLGKVAQPLRVAVTGAGMSPSIDVTLELIGRERCLNRIKKAIEYIEARVAAQ